MKAAPQPLRRERPAGKGGAKADLSLPLSLPVEPAAHI
jgi:hypothetical protein